MCGIVGAIAQRDVIEVLIEGLKRLEYRGYDSAGAAVIKNGVLKRVRSLGKVSELVEKLKQDPLPGATGIAHTRWATHGKPSEKNAHPHVSGTIAIVHNGIIENFAELKEKLINLSYKFESDTDTEVMAHLINYYRKTSENLLQAVQRAVKDLRGAYGAAVIDSKEPDSMVVARCGSPLVIGMGIGENFVASDQLALLPVTQKFLFLEEGDVALLTRRVVTVYDKSGNVADRKPFISSIAKDSADKNGFSHYMLKEIFEQPESVVNTIEARITSDHFIPEAFGAGAAEIFSKIKHVQIVACGTSYHAGLVSRYWLEQYAGVSCSVEIASEYRYRKSVTMPDSLFVTLSQSGETADTLEALRLAKKQGYVSTLTICNVASSSLVRESELCFMTRAGAEIGVASTKAFTTQLVALLLLMGSIGVSSGKIDSEQEKDLLKQLHNLPGRISDILKIKDDIAKISQKFQKKSSCLFLGRGVEWPIAMEGALKLKEISYIHAEAYASGELKHGPIALVDENMPVVIVAPTNDLLEKLKSNIESVHARNGEIYIFTDENAGFENIFPDCNTCHIIKMPVVENLIEPVVYAVPLQLLAYYVAVLKGTDVDQPRNLAKSVTVE